MPRSWESQEFTLSPPESPYDSDGSLDGPEIDPLMPSSPDDPKFIEFIEGSKEKPKHDSDEEWTDEEEEEQAPNDDDDDEAPP